MLASNGIEELGVAVVSGHAVLNHYWIPYEFLHCYDSIDAQSEVLATTDWPTGSTGHCQYQDFFIGSVWKPEAGLFYEIDYELREDEDCDTVDDGEVGFARFIGLNNLERDDWMDLPSGANKPCE